MSVCSYVTVSALIYVFYCVTEKLPYKRIALMSVFSYVTEGLP